MWFVTRDHCIATSAYHVGRCVATGACHVGPHDKLPLEAVCKQKRTGRSFRILELLCRLVFVKTEMLLVNR